MKGRIKDSSVFLYRDIDDIAIDIDIDALGRPRPLSKRSQIVKETEGFKKVIDIRWDL